jgi:hypothetical protein
MTNRKLRFTFYVSRGTNRLALASAMGVGLCLLLTGLLGHAGAPAVSPETVLYPDARVAALMTQITTGSVAAYERMLTGQEAVLIGGQAYTLTTRYTFSGEPISQATRLVYEHFQSLGLEVTFHTYTYLGHSLRNVIAERPGLRRAGEVYLITAHLDNLPAGPVAPGADDNASGSTTVLVAADLLNQLDLDCSIRFALFTGEEQWLRGSSAYATEIAAAGDDVRGVLNLDMIAYNSDADPSVDLHTRSAIPGSLLIAETFSQVVAAYGLDLAPEVLVDDLLGDYSDNKAFWDQGYAAILAIEDADDFNPYYHTVNDRLETLDLDYFTALVRAGVGTLAHLGCLASTGQLTGTVSDLDTGAPLAATVAAVAPGHVYSTTTDAGGYYTLALPVYVFAVQVWPEQVDYHPALVTGVAVLTNTTTVQNFVLKAWPHRFFAPLLLKQS